MDVAATAPKNVAVIEIRHDGLTHAGCRLSPLAVVAFVVHCACSLSIKLYLRAQNCHRAQKVTSDLNKQT